MKILLAIVITIAVLFAVAGCNKEEAARTSAPAAESTKSEPAAETPKPEATTSEPAPKPGADGFVTTKSGLKYKDKKVGTGVAVKDGDYVTVHYKGWLDNGKVFDTSKKAGREPFSFPVGGGQVIKGWDEGLIGMKVGGIRELTIPPTLGYGSEDMGVIPPNSTLHFEIELLKIGE